MSSATTSSTRTTTEARTGPTTSASAVPPDPADLLQSLAEVKGQAQFLLYLADQIEDSLQQLNGEADAGHSAFLCRVLSMYSNQLEAKYHSLGDKITETCQEVYVTVRDYDAI